MRARSREVDINLKKTDDGQFCITATETQKTLGVGSAKPLFANKYATKTALTTALKSKIKNLVETVN